jgi:hypothetical protein
MHAFPLPEAVVMYFHPFDLYVSDVIDNVSGWKRRAHLRNADRAQELLGLVLTRLQELGYKFVLMRDLAAYYANRPETPMRALTVA